MLEKKKLWFRWFREFIGHSKLNSLAFQLSPSVFAPPACVTPNAHAAVNRPSGTLNLSCFRINPEHDHKVKAPQRSYISTWTLLRSEDPKLSFSSLVHLRIQQEHFFWCIKWIVVTCCCWWASTTYIRKEVRHQQKHVILGCYTFLVQRMWIVELKYSLWVLIQEARSRMCSKESYKCYWRSFVQCSLELSSRRIVER